MPTIDPPPASSRKGSDYPETSPEDEWGRGLERK